MFQVMRFAVQEINNSSLILPNVSLGYEIFDHCSDKFNFQSILNMISRNGSIRVLRCVNKYLSKVIAVAGPFRSMESMTVAPLFAMNLIPMVNYGSSSSVLSDKWKYPSFLRTTASNKDLIHLIILIIQHFNWNWVAFSDQAEKVGSYETDPTVAVPFSINNTKIHWYADQVPVARCSPECSEGFAKKKDGLHQCCFQCNVCPGMTYVNYTGVLLALTLAIVILFALNYDKPVVKSAGGPMCFLLLGCLSASSISVFFFFGKPTVTNCVLRYFLFLLFYTVCLGCFAVRSFQIVCIFKMATKFPKIHSWWVKHNGQWWLIAIVFVLQLLLLTTVFTASPPTPVNDMTSYRDQIILKCAMRRTVIMFLLLTIVLASLCFIFSYMGKDLPKNYNESKAITLYLLFLILTWIIFCTASILYHGKYLQLFNAMSVLSSSYSILFCYFLPKCYIIIFQPQKNTQQHFQEIIQRYTQNISSK
ncbi:taste receptor type 1 member 1-like [Salvelinus alpinus]